ncbi:hypothetical protein Golax_025210 [Gossypium laxum]|uniref:2,4-dienoyl-CoA reductase [(3E)-enoyl-CoA-producing] n=1 Tax=Gossypium laxum TaxID=34288 RepID=A0A7J8ZF71_9ROSI|nr:hypothetical protein [Gossypium laxum]
MESPFKADILKGKVGLITGGGSGIGFEISTQLGKHGASIAIMGRRKHVLQDAVSALQSLGIHAVGFEGDVRKQEDAKRVIESTFKHFGHIDILVNAAAGNFLVPAEDLSTNGFRTVMDIDSVGTFTMCREALEYLKKGGPVDSITRNLALEWGTDYDIRVNGIAPGPIADTPGFSKLAPDEITIKAREHLPSYKIGDKWDIAMSAIYLVSDAGKFVNGTTLVVDGGHWLRNPRRLPKEEVKQLSRVVEKRSRETPVGVPSSKL